MDTLRHWTENLGAILTPHVCILCGDDAGTGLDLCPGCRADLPYLRRPCQVCGRPLAATQATCGRCLRRPPRYHRSRIPFHYASPVDRFVQALKFEGQLQHARLLGELLAAAGEVIPVARPQLLLPVPLHPRRLRQRGFNQALEIARICGRRLHIPVTAGACERIRDTRPQTDLSGAERRRNVRDAFRVIRTTSLPPHVAIVDDVVTTGQTVSELARVLRRHGVTTVEVWAVARAGR